MSLEGFIYNFDYTVDLRDSDCTDIVEFWNSLFTLRYTACDYDGLFDFLGSTNHVDKGSLGRVDDGTTVNQH